MARSPARPLTDLVLVGAVVAAITLVLYPISELDPGVSSGVLYVLGVLLLATYRGLWVGLAASLASALALAWFHASPTGGLGGKSAGDYVAIGVLLITATIASVIADRARARAAEATERVRFEEASAARKRVVKAADEERRRLVRDLHDGVQQRLVHTIVTLQLAHGRLDHRDGDQEAAELVGEALEHARRTMDDLRELARGILPAVLTRGGLHAGVAALASRMPVPVETDVTRERYPQAIEATAYFVVAEALTNVAKHAHARRAWVTAAPHDGALWLEVRDDGVGGARPRGAGLLGMGDRLAALDGRLRVESPRDGGTLIAATLPVANGGA